MPMFPAPPLSLSLAGLRPEVGGEGESGTPSDPRSLIEWAASLGYRAVQLDATAAGLRPRELDRSARRDLAAILRRLELGLSGLDLWIPPKHYTDPARAPRAIDAVLQAIDLAADLVSLTRAGPSHSAGRAGVVSLSLPSDPPGSVLSSLADPAERTGVRIADHAWPPSGRSLAPDQSEAPIGIGFDPAGVMLAGDDPVQQAARLGHSIVSARLSDLSPAGRTASGSGDGRLDETAYIASLVTGGYAGSLILDLRGLPRQGRAAREVARRWLGPAVPRPM